MEDFVVEAEGVQVFVVDDSPLIQKLWENWNATETDGSARSMFASFSFMKNRHQEE
jgi:cell fate (sporulation/competence/biofilm development) regulator YlbF (YheA/YmcA/DUF963 family)